MNRLRILVFGGVFSYRALFGWLSPWILVPSLVVTPVAQILLFAYLGRSAGVRDDDFFVIGNAFLYGAIPCLFGMTSTVVGERLRGTLGMILASPAPRLALLLGRSLPVLVNGFGVAIFGLVVGGAVLGAGLPARALGPIVLAVLVSVCGCVGLGLVCAAIGLRFLDTGVLPNLFIGVLLIFSGANVPRDTLPAWMVQIGGWLPLTHGIEAARRLAAGRSLGDVYQLLGAELLLALAYGTVGALLLRTLEVRSRRAATLDLV